MPALDGNRITADGTYTVATIPGQAYVFSASGDFGSGSLAIQWNDGTTATAFAASPATSAETWTITAPTRQVDLVLTGSTDPDIRISLAPVDAGAVTNASVNTAIAADPAATRVAAGLDDGSGNLPVTGVTLSDTTGTSLPSGTLGLNAGGALVVHDQESNAENLPALVDSRSFSPFVTAVASAAMNSQSLAAFHVLDIPLTGAQATSGNVIYIQGQIFSRWTPGNKPDGGVFLAVCADGLDPLVDFAAYPIATGDTTEVRSFAIGITLGAVGQNWVMSPGNISPNSIVAKNSAGTVTHEAEWDTGDYVAGGDVDGVSGQPNTLRFYILSSDSSGTVVANLSTNGFLTVSIP